MEHASDDDLVALADGRLDDGRREALLGHADGCAPCRELLAGVGRAVHTPAPADALDDGEAGTPLVRGTQVGRYLITDQLGAGGMGEVHAAYDPELDRRVALKLLHPGRGDERPRLLREAQAMARLSHPNVVPVHDVGVWGERFFVAMELVEGQTLRAWLARPRSWRRILAMFDQAGRGLAAAHAVGIVHRDFKPDNVLVGVDDRVRVADFGVARTPGEPEAGDPARPAGVPASEPRVDMTRTGMMLGTPAYMAPEVLAGGPATAASDQYAFCVALHEALYGFRPFTIDADLALTPARGAPAKPAAGRRVPAWLRRIVLRGIAPRPEQRWPSMTALLAELGKDPMRHVRRGALAAIVAAGVAVAVLRPGLTPAARPCTGVESLAGIWDGAARERARLAFTNGEAGGAGPAAHVFESFAAAVDGWAGRWQRARTRSCEETFVERTQTEDVMDLRAACLDRQLADLRAVAQVAGQPSPRLVETASQLAAGLPDASRCDRRAVLGSRLFAPRDPATQAAADQLGAELSHAEALSRAGRYEDALDLSVKLEARALALGHPPVEARALDAHAAALQGLRRPSEAEPLLLRAHRLASALGDDVIALRALSRLVSVVGILEAKPDEGLALARDAELLAARTGDRQETSGLAYALGVFHFEKRQVAAAEADFERSRAEILRGSGPDDFRLLGPLNGLGTVASTREDGAAALRYKQECLALAERVLGPDDRRTAMHRGNLGSLYLHELRDYAAARRELERALPPPGRTLTTTDGLNHVNLGLARARLGEYHGAIEEMEQGLALLVKGYGVKHHLVATVNGAIGDVLAELEREPEALVRYRSALEQWRAVGEDDFESNTIVLAQALVAASIGQTVDLAAARAALAVIRRDAKPDGQRVALGAALVCHLVLRLHRRDLAPADCAAARLATLIALPADHPDRAFALWGIAQASQASGTPDVPLLEEALAILERRGGDVILAADIRMTLARAVAAADPGRARKLAAASRAALVAAIGPRSRRVAAIDELLESL